MFAFACTASLGFGDRVDREIDDEKDVICRSSGSHCPDTEATKRYKTLLKEKCREYREQQTRNGKRRIILGLMKRFSFVVVKNGRVSLEYCGESNYDRVKKGLNKEYNVQTRTTVAPPVASEENAPAVASGQVGHSLSQTHNQIAGDGTVNHGTVHHGTVNNNTGPVHTGDVHYHNYNGGEKLGKIERKLDDLTLGVRNVGTSVENVDNKVQSVDTKVQSVNNKVDYMTPYKAPKQGDTFTPPRQPIFATPAAREPHVESPTASTPAAREPSPTVSETSGLLADDDLHADYILDDPDHDDRPEHDSSDSDCCPMLDLLRQLWLF